ncbi:fibroblast growth factor 18-like isoform X2 [Dermochelys coriacea]|uniref:fibroblast growth factor 18-like isoform X2 n=1 Tax=Dermochelys coriacea TaxID=27794 RepID=UPI001CA82F9F|nr:fibroblast growth factor 18-like isoform X2 [Dermochelys coriacea]
MPQPPPEGPDPQSRSGEPGLPFPAGVSPVNGRLPPLRGEPHTAPGRGEPPARPRLPAVQPHQHRAPAGPWQEALLAMESDTFGSHVRIKGKETGYYVCMDRRGKVLGKLDGRSRGCVFVEEVLENNYTAFMSAWHQSWYLGFTRKGRAQTGPRTHRTQREGHFMKRPPKGTGGEGQSPFRFTALPQWTKRALGP